MHSYLVFDNHQIKENNANICMMDAGRFLSLTFHALVILSLTGVRYPIPSGLRMHAYRSNLFNSYHHDTVWPYQDNVLFAQYSVMRSQDNDWRHQNNLFAQYCVMRSQNNDWMYQDNVLFAQYSIMRPQDNDWMYQDNVLFAQYCVMRSQDND